MSRLVKFYTSECCPMWGIITDDHGYVVGEWGEVKKLHKALASLIETGEAEEIEITDHRLQLVKWLTVSEAVDLALSYGQIVTGRAIRYACQREEIEAKREGSVWHMPVPSFTHWLKNRPRPGPKRKT